MSQSLGLEQGWVAVPTAARAPLIVPPQAIKDLKALGCKKAMKKFNRHTLLVSDEAVHLSCHKRWLRSRA